MNEAMRKACIRGTPEQLAAAGLLEQREHEVPCVGGVGFFPVEGTLLMTSHNYGLPQPPGVIVGLLIRDETGEVYLNGTQGLEGQELEVVVFRPERDETSISMMRYAARGTNMGRVPE